MNTGRLGSRMTRWVAAMATVLLALAPWAVQGGDVYWNNFNPVGNPKDFNTDANWLPAAVPGPADRAVFTNFPHAYNLAWWGAPVTNQAAVFDFTAASALVRLGYSTGPADWTILDTVTVGNSTASGKPDVHIGPGRVAITNAAGTGTLYANWGTTGNGLARLTGGELVADHIYGSNTFAWSGFDAIDAGILTTRGDCGLARVGGAFYLANYGNAAATWNIVGGTCTMGQDLYLGAPNVYGGTPPAATATVVVAGNTTELLAARSLSVGAQGNGLGHLIITNGGLAQVGGLLYVGNSGTPSNSITVTGSNSLLKTLSQVYVKSVNYGNVIRVADGGTWEHNTGNALYFNGVGPSTNSGVIIDGAGSRFTGWGSLQIGGGASVNGQGWLIVSNGGAMTNSAWGTISVGNYPGCYGELRVEGTGSVLRQPGGYMIVGRGNAWTPNMGTGKVVIANGGLLDSAGIYIGSNTWGNLTCSGGILQFGAATPVLNIREAGGVVLTNATVSFRDNAAGSVTWQHANITYQGRNGFRLNNTANAASGQTYLFDVTGDPKHYTRLEMVNGSTRYRGGGVTIGPSGSLLISNTEATFDSTVTNNGAIEAQGTINGTVLNRNGSTFSLDSAAAAASLTVNDTLALETGATLDVTLNGTNVAAQCDQLVLAGSGTLDLNADSGAGSTLRVTLAFAPEPGYSVKIVDNQGGTITGRFTYGLVEAGYGGKVYPFAIAYNAGTGDDIVLTLVSRGMVITVR